MGSESVGHLQERLFAAAKASPERRFYSLRDKLTRWDVLQQAWETVRENGGAPGVDGVTIGDIKKQGVDSFLRDLQVKLSSGTYRAQPVRRVSIPKPSGGVRDLGIPSVVDRVAQAAAKVVLEPIFEADFLPCSFGFRPNRSAHDAAHEVQKWLNFGLENVLDADLRWCFDEIPHHRLMNAVGRRVSDGYVLSLIRMWLSCGVMVGGGVEATEVGTPQGGVVSPLLANIYLHEFDREWTRRGLTKRGGANAQLVRYADDFVIISSKSVRSLVPVVQEILSSLGLSLNVEKSRVVRAEKGFDFLGFRFVRRFSQEHGKEVTRFFPSPKSMNRARERIRNRSDSHNMHVVPEEMVQNLNRFLRGWREYFRHSHAWRPFLKLQYFVNSRVRIFLRRRKQRSGLGRYRDLPNQFLYEELGLVNLASKGIDPYAHRKLS